MIKRLLLVLVLCAAVAGVGPTAADAGRECDGLIVCIPVAGPWVQVFGTATPTYYELRCPGRGQVIGGLDADRAGPLGISFLGSLGGPVGPGVTTRRAAVFVAQTTALALRLPAAARLHPRQRRRRPEPDELQRRSESCRPSHPCRWRRRPGASRTSG